jgi:16S rRNA G527 N7-methylase RsmG
MAETVASETLKRKTAKPAYLQSLNESEKQANFKVIESMNKKISFLKNPRHKKNRAPIIMTDACKAKVLDESAMKATSFRAEPNVLNFIDYQVNAVYEMPLKITNIEAVSKRIKFIPPQTDNFTVREVKFPSDDTGDIAPGMSLTM